MQVFRYFHGSTVECAACLDLLFIKQVLTEAELDEGKKLLSAIVGLVIGLIKSELPDRFGEDDVEYRTGGDSGSESMSESMSKSEGNSL